MIPQVLISGTETFLRMDEGPRLSRLEFDRVHKKYFFVVVVEGEKFRVVEDSTSSGSTEQWKPIENFGKRVPSGRRKKR